MPVARLRREAQVERNRGLLLAAARRVFLARGYHRATIEAIAEEAGFSKGVVYSQFESKADLFLALLERRISERAAENERVLREAGGGAAGVAALLSLGGRRAREEPDWDLLVLEFRTQAARDPKLNQRYARAHARTIDGMAAVLERLPAETAVTPGWPPRMLAKLVLALAAGASLENLAVRDSLPSEVVLHFFVRALGLPSESGR